MNSFRYFSPQTITAAYDLWLEFSPGAYFLAGGTDILVRIKTGRIAPSALIDLKAVPELVSRIEEKNGFVEISALTLMSEIQCSGLIARSYPALTEAAASVGSVQIRNRGTLAGNLCNASPAADTAPALLVHNAQVRTIFHTGSRTIPLDNFILGPGKNSLQPGELVEAILLPLSNERYGEAFERLTRRKGVDLATVNVCVHVQASDVTRIAVGAAGPTPFLVEDLSGTLADPMAGRETKRHLLEKLMSKASPISDIRAGQDYRQAMLVVLAERALEKALVRLAA